MTTPSQARNSIFRALVHVAGIRFDKNYKSRCRAHFRGCCAYCEAKIDPISRKGHFDHAQAVTTTTHNFNLVYACSTCNGDEKLEGDWEPFLRRKCQGDDKLFQSRREVIANWFATEPAKVLSEDKHRALMESHKAALDGFNSSVEAFKARLHQMKLEEETL